MGIISVASNSAKVNYTAWAQDANVQVWANVTDVYAHPVRAYPHIGHLLRDANARARVVEQLYGFANSLNLDGLVINIESLQMFRYGPYYVQFMRELNIALGGRVILASAMLVDPAINPHYRHDLIAKTIDYIILMTYDEHHGYSPQPGPTASLPWVERQISTMLRLVPSHQLIMGMPFYNRVWRTAVLDNTRRGTLNWSMDWAQYILNYQGVEMVWDSVIGSYFAYFSRVDGGEAVYHQIWLECPRSIAMKMQIYAVYNLAGVASWHLGFANDMVWDVIGAYFR
jgi:spore germination protein YaaH